MEVDGSDAKRVRSDNWSRAEIDALIGAIAPSRTVLFGKHDGPGGTQQNKKGAWDDVAKAVGSAGGGSKRTPQHCKDKFGSLKKQLKKRALLIKKSLQKTGGGRGGPPPLDQVEERVLAIAGHVAIYGIPEGSSSSSPTINPSKSPSSSATSSPFMPPSSSSPQHPPAIISHAVHLPTSSSSSASASATSSSTSSHQKKRKSSLIRRQDHFLSVEDRRLAMEEERLEVERKRLAVEEAILKVQQERLDVERQRLAVEYERLQAERHERMGDLSVLVSAVEEHEH